MAGAIPDSRGGRGGMRDYGTIILCEDDAEMVEVADGIAPEHLEVQTDDPVWFA